VWIAIAVIAVLVVAALVLGLVLYRRRRISLDSSTAVERDTTKPIDRSGGYTASSGITFSQSAPPVAPPTETPERIDTDGLPAVGVDPFGGFGGWGDRRCRLAECDARRRGVPAGAVDRLGGIAVYRGR